MLHLFLKNLHLTFPANSIQDSNRESARRASVASFDLAKVTLLLLLMAVLPLSLTACGGGGGGGGSGAEVVRIPPSKPSYGVDEGEAAKMETLSQLNPVSTYFDKRYNRPNLEGVLRASGNESAKYIQAMDVSLYRVPTSAQVPYFLKLSLAPDNLVTVWNDAAGGVTDGTLAGLYFEACGFVRCQTPSNPMPTILVAQTSTRWTIVHEMMHHLFNMQRKREGTLSYGSAIQRLDQSTKRLQYDIDQFKQFNDRAYLDQAAGVFEESLKWTKAALAAQALEETTVERVLVDEWANERLFYVDKTSPVNAVWYMATNAQKALEFTATLHDTLLQVLQFTDDAQATAAHDRIAQIIENLDGYNSEIKKTVTDAAIVVKQKVGSLDRGSGGSSESGFIGQSLGRVEGCLGDGHELEKIRMKLKKVTVR